MHLCINSTPASSIDFVSIVNSGKLVDVVTYASSAPVIEILEEDKEIVFERHLRGDNFHIMSVDLHHKYHKPNGTPYSVTAVRSLFASYIAGS
jgi:hypothetical protein